MLSPLIDFCNIRSWDRDTILAYCAEHHHAKPRITDEMFTRLEKVQPSYQAFLDSCMAGKPDLGFVNNRAQYLRGEPATFVFESDGEARAKPGSQRFFYFHETEDPWQPGYRFRPARPENVEQIADACIVKILLEGKGKLFSKIKKCDHCDGYMPYRKKSKRWCSRKCHNDYHNPKYVKNGYKAEYMKRKRDEGDPKYFK